MVADAYQAEYAVEKKGMNYACFSVTIARRQHVLPAQRLRISRCHPRKEISRDGRKILRFESISVIDLSRSFDIYSNIYTKVHIIFELSTRWKVVWLNWTRWIKNIIGLRYLRSCLTCSETQIHIYDIRPPLAPTSLLPYRYNQLC